MFSSPHFYFCYSDQYTLHSVREAVEALNELEDKLKYLAKIAFDERQHIQTISNDVTRLLRYKETSDAKLAEEYGGVVDLTSHFDISKTPLSQELKLLLEHNLSLHQDLDVFVSETDTVHLGGVVWKLSQIQDKIIALIEREEAELKARNSLSSEGEEEETSAKVLQLQRHQVQLDLIQRRRNSISRRSNELIREVDITCHAISSVERKVDSSTFEDVPKSPLCYLDVLKSDWRENARVQEKKITNNRCQNYQTLMASRNLPVCDDVYRFLINPDENANILAISNYSFAPGELATMLSFLVVSPSTRGRVHTLSLQNSGISDSDCNVIAGAILRLPKLHTLSLRINKISSFGVMKIFTQLWENPGKIELFSVNLDDNDIDLDGAQSIAQAILVLPSLRILSIAGNPISDVGVYHILRACLNSKRRAFREFPRPDVLNVDVLDSSGVDDFKIFISGDVNANVTANFDKNDDNYSRDEDEDDDEEDKDTEFKSSSLKSEGKKLDDDDLSHTSEDSDTVRQKVFRAKPFTKRFPYVIAKLRAVGAFKSCASRGCSLSHLNISNCGLSPFSVQMLVVFISSSYVSEVVYSDNEISREYSTILSHTISNSLYLRTLVLQNTYLSDQSIKEITQGAAKSSSLLCLDLSRNTIGPAGANWIANSTKELYIDNINVTTATVDKQETSGGRAALDALSLASTVTEPPLILNTTKKKSTVNDTLKSSTALGNEFMDML
jgi:hypothetical protein